MARFHVFLKAPTFRELNDSTLSQDYSWHALDCGEYAEFDELPSRATSGSRRSFLPATLEGATRRISTLYENIIFKETPSDGEEEYSDGDTPEDTGRNAADSQGTYVLQSVLLRLLNLPCILIRHRANDIYYLGSNQNQ